MASAATASARTASAAIMTTRRSKRSAAIPAGSPNTANGRTRANATTPAFAGEPVKPRIKSGYAIAVDALPADDSSCPP